MSPIYASDQSLGHFVLEREVSDPDKDGSEREAATALVAAVDAFTTGWVKPLALGFQVVYRDSANFFDEVGRPARPHYFMRRDAVPADVLANAPFSESQIESVATLDPAGTLRALLSALNQKPALGQITSLSHIVWTAVQVRSPSCEPALLDVGGHPSSPVYAMTDGELWYSGPSGIAGPPLKLHAEHTHYTTTLQVELYWDLWLTGPGRVLLDSALSRVAACDGWQRSG